MPIKQISPPKANVPWPTPSLDYCSIGKNHSQIDNPILHCSVSDCIRPTIYCQLSIPDVADVEKCHLQLVPTMPPILAYHVRQYWFGIASFGIPVTVERV